jgi:hypothetical protein
MNSPRRRALPDNLDPLVDTLSNVVGILVIVIALTQLELGDALARIAKGGAAPTSTQATEPLVPPESQLPRADATREQAALAERLEAIRARGGTDLATVAASLRGVLARWNDLAPVENLDADAGRGARTEVEAARSAAKALESSVARARKALDDAQANQSHRRTYAGSLESVPRQLVARLPDPEVVEGREAWIFVRYGRVYPIDREALFDAGRRAIERIVPDGATRSLRPDEMEAVSLYLRKSAIGLGPHRWQLELEPAYRLSLDWQTRDGGIERSRLANDAALASWLAAHRPDVDTIRFHVWSDSFETYLEARTRIEAAGYRAGWNGLEADEELVVGLRFGAPEPEIRRRVVD